MALSLRSQLRQLVHEVVDLLCHSLVVLARQLQLLLDILGAVHAFDLEVPLYSSSLSQAHVLGLQPFVGELQFLASFLVFGCSRQPSAQAVDLVQELGFSPQPLVLEVQPTLSEFLPVLLLQLPVGSLEFLNTPLAGVVLLPKLLQLVSQLPSIVVVPWRLLALRPVHLGGEL